MKTDQIKLRYYPLLAAGAYIAAVVVCWIGNGFVNFLDNVLNLF